MEIPTWHRGARGQICISNLNINGGWHFEAFEVMYFMNYETSNLA